MKTSQRHRDKALRRVNYAEETIVDLLAEIQAFHEITGDAPAVRALEQAEESATEVVTMLKAAKRLLDSSIVAEREERREGGDE